MSTLPTLPAMRIIYFTNQGPEVAVAVLGGLEQLGQRVPLLVTTPGPPARRSETYKATVASLPSGQDVLVTNHINRLPGLLAGLAPDLILVTGFPWKLPPALLDLPRLGCINVHPALLPAYRGPNPLFWQVMNGEMKTGLTVHRMEPEFDTGPILAQRAIPIEPEDDIDSLYPKLLPLGAALIPEALALVAAGVPGMPQSAEGASYAPLSTETDRWLDWSRPATRLRNQVRAWGQQGALGEIEGQRYLVRRASAVPLPPALLLARPGAMLAHGAEGMLVRAGEDGLLIEEGEEAQPFAE